MDDTTPLQDYSGYNRVATTSGTPDKHVSLVKGATYAPVLTSATTAQFAANVFNQSSESSPFTLFAAVKVVAGTGEQQVLGNSGQMDGITVNGRIVSFVTKYSTAPEARCTYELPYSQSTRIWATHTELKNSLYVNGILVDEVSLTEEQRNDTYSSTSTNLFSGTTSGTQTIAVNTVAYYSYALSGQAIFRQNLSALSVADVDSVSRAYGGTTVSLYKDTASLFLDQKWNTEEDWNLGQTSNVGLVNGSLVPQFNGDTSVPGFWYDSVAIASTTSIAIYGVAVDWEGQGVTIQVSLDSTTWETVVRGQKISLIAPGFDPTGKVLRVRASFVGGIVGDESHLSSLNVFALVSSTSEPNNGRTVSLSGATPGNQYHPLDFHDNWGVYVAPGGSVTISADTSADAQVVRTVEIWYKPVTGVMTRNFSTSGGAAYTNGVGGFTDPTVGKWSIAHFVLGADKSDAVVLGENNIIGRVVFYPTALSTAQVTSIYGAYTGTNYYRALDSSVIATTESATAADIYAYDWSITGAG